MKGAVIDMGTNTFSLLIFQEAEHHRSVLQTARGVVNLGEGCIQSNAILPQAMQRAYVVITGFMQLCRTHGIENKNIVAVGTSAMREACNSSELIHLLKRDFDLNVTIISGQEEANIVYEGVRQIHAFSTKNSCIMDIGGGSTEFTVVSNQLIQVQKSYNFGLARLVQMFNLSDPLTQRDLEQLEHYLAQEAAPFFKPTFVDELIGVGGSFETYFNLIYKAFKHDIDQTYQLPLADLYLVLERLIHSSQSERNRNRYIADFRKQMMNVAAVKTKWVLQQLEANVCYFSPVSLKEGVITQKF